MTVGERTVGAWRTFMIVQYAERQGRGITAEVCGRALSVAESATALCGSACAEATHHLEPAALSEET